MGAKIKSKRHWLTGKARPVVIDEGRQTRLRVLKLLAEGKNMKQIGAALGLGVSGVDYHRRIIYQMVGTSNFALIVQWALYHGYAEWKVKPEQMAA